MSDSLWPHGLQHIRPPCPSLFPGVFSSSYPSNQWYYPTISSSATLFSFCLQSFPASGSFWMSQFFESGGRSIGASASALVLPMNIQDWFPFGWTGWIFLQSKRLPRVFSNTTVQKHQFFGVQPSLWSNSHICKCILISMHQKKINTPFYFESLICVQFFATPWSVAHQTPLSMEFSTPFSRGASWPRDWTQASCIASRFIIWASREALNSSVSQIAKWSKIYIFLSSNWASLVTQW